MAVTSSARAQQQEPADGRIDKHSPSIAQYFDWVNRNWYASNEERTLANLEFFKWLRDEYGMTLDIFLLDTATIDNGPNCLEVEGRPAYGTLEMELHRKEYPGGLGVIAKAAKAAGCRPGIWLGPDGYGDTPEDAQKRIVMLESLVRDFGIRQFKFDACCSDLRPEVVEYFMEAMDRCRAIAPDLIVSNHRVNIPEQAKDRVTAYLWQGRETYPDAIIFNPKPAIHHRLGNLACELPPEMSRMLIDHGVCISSCMDFWDDDLVLQAFNRAPIVAPQIYGNPWLLADREFPRLARLMNLHRNHRELLIDGFALPEKQYGPYAVSRGDEKTRLITLRNLTWEPATHTIDLDKSIGLAVGQQVELRQYHPTERLIGKYSFGDKAAVQVDPFRACLLKATVKAGNELTVVGCDYEVERDLPDKPVEIALLGEPGRHSSIRLESGDRRYKKATLDGRDVSDLLRKQAIRVEFPGRPLSQPAHRRLCKLAVCPVPHEAEAFFEACCYAGDSNALEVRSLQRAGTTQNEAVENARQALFDSEPFREQGIWDRFLFDDDRETPLRPWRNVYAHGRFPVGLLRVDTARLVSMDALLLTDVPDDYQPTNARVSDDLIKWRAVPLERHGSDIRIDLTQCGKLRYVQVDPAPMSVSEAIGLREGAKISRSGWRASNLFRGYQQKPACCAWTGRIKIDEITPTSYLAIAIPGDYGYDNAYAALQIGDRIIGAPDRAPSYPYNNWEHYGIESGQYTYYFPLTKEDVNQEIEVYVLGFEDEMKPIVPEVWITASPTPHVRRQLILE